jgi:mitochondrial fission protein ELM1
MPKSCWVLTDGKAGDEAQCIGVAEALGTGYEIRKVAPRPPFSWIMPWGPIDPRDRESRPDSPIAPPFPDIAIASGRRAVAYLRRVKKISNGGTFTVFLKDPRTGPKTADLIWVPEHDDLRGANVLATPTAPHRFSHQALADLRVKPHPQIDALAHPRVAVLIGGNSRHHTFTECDVENLIAGLTRLVDEDGASLMITASRRTPEPLKRRLEHLAASKNCLLWNGSGENPLACYLAKADAIVVTADSTNMIGEAAATGKPVHVFKPHGGHPKIVRFLGTLTSLGIIHPFPGPLKNTTYGPLDSTPMIASEILKRFAGHRTG